MLLALLGLTYGYYLTRIQGNSNTNSISVTTADLRLVYGDGNEIINASNIVPNTTVAEKTFTVTNTGNNIIENYRVVLELALIEGVVPSVFKYPKDFEIRLTCVSKNNVTNEVNGTIMDDWDDNETNPTQMYVGTITADEMVYAGGKPFAYNNNFYLFNENFKNGYFDYVCFSSLSPGNFSRTKGGTFYLYYDGGFWAIADVNEDFFAFRPVVSLKSSATIIAGGEGTKSQPYVVE